MYFYIQSNGRDNSDSMCELMKYLLVDRCVLPIPVVQFQWKTKDAEAPYYFNWFTNGINYEVANHPQVPLIALMSPPLGTLQQLILLFMTILMYIYMIMIIWWWIIYINDDYGIYNYGGVAGKCRCNRGDDGMTMTIWRLFLERRLWRWWSIRINSLI